MWEKYREKIKHLSEKEMENFRNEYYANLISNTKLLKKYGLKSIKVSDIHKTFPLLETDKECPKCRGRLGVLPSSKFEDSLEGYECLVCGHSMSDDSDFQCSCKFCKNEREEIKRKKVDEKKALIHQLYGSKKCNFYSLEEVPIYDLILLATFLEVFLDENNKYTTPIIKKDTNLVYDKIWEGEIIFWLFEEGYLGISDKSSIEAFPDNEVDVFPSRFYLKKVKYYVTCADSISVTDIRMLDFHSYISLLSEEKKEKALEGVLKLWKEISVDESINYLLNLMDRFQFPFSPGEKTIETVKYLVDHLELGVVFQVIFTSISAGCRKAQEKGVSRRHAANTAITVMRRNGDKLIIGEWEKQYYSNPYDLKKSELSSFFFLSFLKVGKRKMELQASVKSLKSLLEEMNHVKE